jgi:hypothetical protein
VLLGRLGCTQASWRNLEIENIKSYICNHGFTILIETLIFGTPEFLERYWIIANMECAGK